MANAKERWPPALHPPRERDSEDCSARLRGGRATCVREARLPAVQAPRRTRLGCGQANAARIRFKNGFMEWSGLRIPQAEARSARATPRSWSRSLARSGGDDPRRSTSRLPRNFDRHICVKKCKKGNRSQPTNNWSRSGENASGDSLPSASSRTASSPIGFWASSPAAPSSAPLAGPAKVCGAGTAAKAK